MYPFSGGLNGDDPCGHGDESPDISPSDSIIICSAGSWNDNVERSTDKAYYVLTSNHGMQWVPKSRIYRDNKWVYAPAWMVNRWKKNNKVPVKSGRYPLQPLKPAITGHLETEELDMDSLLESYSLYLNSNESAYKAFTLFNNLDITDLV